MSENEDRDVRGRFAQGNRGGPGGPRRRASELRRAAEDAISPEHIQAMIRKATRMGLEGNLAAMRLVFERTSGRVSEAPAEPEPISITLPRLRTAADCNAAIEKLVDGLCDGSVDREAARMLIDVLQFRLKSIEVKELEDRLVELEKATGTVKTLGNRQLRSER